MTNPLTTRLEQQVKQLLKDQSANIRSPLNEWEQIRGLVEGPVASAIAKAIADVEEGHKLPRADNGGFTVQVVHYTSLAVIIKMLQRSCGDTNVDYLRMYSSIGFNDPGEGTYFTRIAREFMRETSEQAEAKDFCEIIWKLTNYLADDSMSAQRYAYVASFIRPCNQNEVHRTADNLPFWRTYGHEGTGCSLAVTISPDNLYEVRYGPKAVDETICKLNDSIGAAVRLVRELNNPHATEAMRKIFQFRMQRLDYLYKSEAYDYERECRIVETPVTLADGDVRPVFEYSGPPGVERTTRFINHPILTTDPAEGILRSGSFLTLGPCVANREDTKEFLELLRTAAGLAGLRVRLSEIEYRNASNR